MKWLLTIIWGLIMVSLVNASPIGYNQTDDYLHVWNNGTTEPNYYYFGDCMNQISNIPNEQWEIVNKYFGIVVNGNWILLGWGSQYPCIRSDSSDFLTYSNNSAVTSINNVNLGLYSHIKLNDDKITQIFEFDAPIATTTDVWFILQESNISIANTTNNDWLIMHKNNTWEKEFWNLTAMRENNQTYYFYSKDYEPSYFLYDNVEKKNILNEFFNNSYNWFIKVDENVSLYVNLSKLNGTKKQFIKKWVDAGCTCTGSLRAFAYSNYPNGTSHNVSSGNFTMQCATLTQGFGGCSGCNLEWWEDLSNPKIINTTGNATDILECPTGAPIQCVQKIKKYGSTSWHNNTIVCLKAIAAHGTWCKHEDNPNIFDNQPSGTTTIECLALIVEKGISGAPGLFKEKRTVYPVLLLFMIFSVATIFKKNEKEEQNKN